MKRSLRFPAIILATLTALAGCASTATRLPEISAPDLLAESLLQESRALEVQSAHRHRLSRIGRRILLANAELCPKTRRDIGVIIHSDDSYAKEMRIAARRELGVLDRPSIFHVIPNSPADIAGLKQGDVILIDEKAVDATDKALQDALSSERAALSIDRDGQRRTITVEPQTLCHSRLRLRSSAAINAIADGRHITVTTGMMEFAQSDDELAMVIGHELAHNTMGHIRKVIGNLILSGFATRYTRPFESESDYVGLYYMVRAGFDPDGVETFWRRLADVDPRSVNRAKTHPTFPDRYLRIAAARGEIRAKQAAGEPLVPNFKADAEGE
ncbi:M48 family metalloprotease [Algimonas porphyrae]|uniref:M48 family metallopeptidase n=1 Tax=Algimonas porphyrae TaxID=1128113 RepID=UPI0024E0EFD6|nr:M48 family metallopeptidase [Algimonas porphyrae]